MREAHQKTGFSLVELLVTVAILGVLIGLLLPTVTRARESASRVQCLSNIRQSGIAMQLYAVNFGGQIPIGRSESSWWSGSGIYGRESASVLISNGNFTNFGTLYAAGLLPQPLIVYCPRQWDPRQRFNTDVNPWPPPVDTSVPSYRTRAGFTTRPEVAWQNRAYPPGGMARLSQLQSRTVIATDLQPLPNSFTGVGFRLVPHRNAGIVLYADLSAAVIPVLPSSTLRTRLQQIASATNPGQSFFITSPTATNPGLWQLLDASR